MTTPPAATVCSNCETPIELAARHQRAAAGSKGDAETPGMCWVCARLRHTNVREEAELKKYMEEE
jgi:hypothetical protein